MFMSRRRRLWLRFWITKATRRLRTFGAAPVRERPLSSHLGIEGPLSPVVDTSPLFFIRLERVNRG
jgi:hypothetical protein